MYDTPRTEWGAMPSGYRPSDFLEFPSDFGYTPNPQWRADALDEARLASARLQHLIALAIRKTHGEAAPKIAARRLGRLGAVDYVRRKLNGQIPITLVDLAKLRQAFPAETKEAIQHWLED